MSQALSQLTDLQYKFLIQINAYHQTISDNRGDEYRLTCIVDLIINKATQSIVVTFKNNEVFSYNRYGTIHKKIKHKKGEI
ncbi:MULTISPECIES: hypothetical protein [Lysinibacillus]|uniref:hypothetical protein n=1 Tax=Lysinibacillus TaxID=400634 RepID=UPI0021A5FEE2|nr:hypothetical protein [Lysinibacillus capsici]MCT1538427.1 hypothetical protein [Lysinibacillus capsici]MCT1569135.1 hypothetical protein [Lysinibacillus capsici]MCT1646150.1 hypothetical protein [Lysinibacillus capsici]MCT1725344.1 hypothetical protein [Lysinibacillus capsici]MCT1784124.1 hypothetical protein [Lysinibacillus capsici]